MVGEYYNGDPNGLTIIDSATGKPQNKMVPSVLDKFLIYDQHGRPTIVESPSTSNCKPISTTVS